MGEDVERELSRTDLSTTDQLTIWLLERGFGEELRGYGHATAEEIAEALVDAGWVTMTPDAADDH